MRILRLASWKSLVVAVAMTVPVLVGATPAYAASWQVVASPNPTQNDQLARVTALSPSNLWTVGGATSLHSSEATLVEHYDGTSWKAVPR